MPRRQPIPPPSSDLSPLPLPTEIMSMIFSHLDVSDRSSLARCCRVSNAFLDLAGPMLYRKIVIGPDTEKDARRDCDPKAGKSGRNNPETRKSKLLHYVEEIVIGHHDRPEMTCGRGLRVGNLRVLKLEVKTSKLHVNCPPPNRFEECSLLSQIQPEKVVVCGTQLGHRDLFSSRTNIISSTKKLVFKCPSGATDAEVRYCSPHHHVHIPRTVDTVVWILQVYGPEERWKYGEVHQAIFEHAAVRVQGVPNRFDPLHCLATAIVHSAVQPIIVVGADRVRPDFFRVEREDQDVLAAFSRALKQMVRTCLKDLFLHRWTPVRAEELDQKTEDTFARLTFSTMENYLATQDWTGEFEYNEVKEWLMTK